MTSHRPPLVFALASLLAACGSTPPTGGAESAVAAKPQHTVTLPGISGLLTLLLGDLYLQFDQTDDPTHAGMLTARHATCVPASAGEKASCRVQCPDLGDINLIKVCNQRCADLVDCIPNTCLTFPTPNLVTFGSGFKSAFSRPCASPSDSCPSCTVGQPASVIGDVDLSSYLPDPIFKTTILFDPLSCRLNTFGIDLRTRPSFNFNDWVTIDPGNPFHVQVKAFASEPTVRCTNGISPTLRNPLFDFYLKTSVVNHHPSLQLVANFTSHVDYAFDWAYNLDSKVNDTVNGAVNGILGRNQGQLNEQLEKLLAARIQQVNGEQVDDFIDVHFDNDSLVVVYTPRCVDGQCSCTPDCGGRQCGNDARCGVSCGTCKYGSCDDPSGTCQCTPRSGCGGQCGRIADGCGGFLVCPACGCTPSCAGKRCGQSDGCNGTCSGRCPARFTCQTDQDGLKMCVYTL